MNAPVLILASVVVEPNPVCNHPASVRQAFKAVPMRALLFQCADHLLLHAVRLRGVRRDELLLKAVAFHQRAVAAAGKYTKPLSLHSRKRCGTRPRQPRRLISACSSADLVVLDLPAPQLEGAAVDHKRQVAPAILSGPDEVQVIQGQGVDIKDSQPLQ